MSVELPALTALNHDLRTAYIKDCETGVTRWNRILDRPRDHRAPAGPAARRASTARSALFAGCHVTPGGQIVDAAAWAAGRPSWLPTPADKAHVESLMRPVYEPGKIAAWLAPPRNGINGQPLDYEYVRF